MTIDEILFLLRGFCKSDKENIMKHSPPGCLFFFLRKGHKTIAPTVQPPPPLNLFLWIELIVLSEVSVLPPLSHGSKNNNRQTQIFFFL